MDLADEKESASVSMFLVCAFVAVSFGSSHCTIQRTVVHTRITSNDI